MVEVGTDKVKEVTLEVKGPKGVGEVKGRRMIINWEEKREA